MVDPEVGELKSNVDKAVMASSGVSFPHYSRKGKGKGKVASVLN
jgi:hypothetical protein